MGGYRKVFELSCELERICRYGGRTGLWIWELVVVVCEVDCSCLVECWWSMVGAVVIVGQWALGSLPELDFDWGGGGLGLDTWLWEVVVVQWWGHDRSERPSNLHSTDGDKNSSIGLQSASSTDHSDTGSSKCVYECFHPQLITLNGCCRSEASQLLHERWKAAIRCYSDPTVDLSVPSLGG
ncbi:Ni-sirohydrochlorin a c-diamide reductive cyclase complex component CfbD [Bienertia sinuspersici]